MLNILYIFSIIKGALICTLTFVLNSFIFSRQKLNTCLHETQTNRTVNNLVEIIGCVVSYCIPLRSLLNIA